MVQSPGEDGTLDNRVSSGHAPGIAHHKLGSVEAIVL